MQHTIGIITLMLLLGLSYSYDITFLAQKENIALSYGEKRILRIPLDTQYEKYSYAIQINGKPSDPHIKVMFLDSNYTPIQGNTIHISQGKKAILYANNRIKELREIYLLLYYYTPSQTNTLKKVKVELIPVVNTQTQSEVTSVVLPGINYNLNVYLNAHFTSSSPSPPPASSTQTTPPSQDTQTTPPVDEDQDQSNTPSNTYPASQEKESNISTSSEENNTTPPLINETPSEEEKESIPTGKVIAPIRDLGVDTSTIILIIVGIIALIILWKKL